MKKEIEVGFDEFWLVKPRRKGSNPKSVALKSFSRCVMAGADPQKIISAARKWCEQERENGKLDTEYVAMAATWLNQRRFEDFEGDVTDYSKCDAIAAQHGYAWNGEKYVRV